MSHVKTQLPYAVLAGVIGVLVGNLPIGLFYSLNEPFVLLLTGYEAYPNVVGIIVGLFTCFVITYLLSAKIDSNSTDKVGVVGGFQLLTTNLGHTIH